MVRREDPFSRRGRRKSRLPLKAGSIRRSNAAATPCSRHVELRLDANLIDHLRVPAYGADYFLGKLFVIITRYDAGYYQRLVPLIDAQFAQLVKRAAAQGGLRPRLYVLNDGACSHGVVQRSAVSIYYAYYAGDTMIVRRQGKKVKQNQL
jgi:hypothetical protein